MCLVTNDRCFTAGVARMSCCRRADDISQSRERERERESVLTSMAVCLSVSKTAENLISEREREREREKEKRQRKFFYRLFQVQYQTKLGELPLEPEMSFCTYLEHNVLT